MRLVSCLMWGEVGLLEAVSGTNMNSSIKYITSSCVI